ncbi:MAG TPA: hypothetical protein VK497_01785 [Candidatus Saccharimonadales bacterium]|nr:hypothetical protein [Candidatus Saccharimonadales bacterium]
MTRFNQFRNSNTRIADLPWGQMTQFVTRLNNAGLTGDDVKKLLDNPELLIKVAEATKALLAEPIWGSGRFFLPTKFWNTIDGTAYNAVPKVQMKRPEGYDFCCANSNHILVHVRCENCSCNTHWAEATLVHLSDQWVDVARGVQVQKSHSDGIVVRTLKAS